MRLNECYRLVTAQLYSIFTDFKAFYSVDDMWVKKTPSINETTPNDKNLCECVCVRNRIEEDTDKYLIYTHIQVYVSKYNSIKCEYKLE